MNLGLVLNLTVGSLNLARFHPPSTAMVEDTLLSSPGSSNSEDIVESIEKDVEMDLNDYENATNLVCKICGDGSPRDEWVLPCDCSHGLAHKVCLQNAIPETQWQFNGVALCSGCDGTLEENDLEEALDPLVWQEYKLRQTEVRTPFIMRTYCHDKSCDAWIPGAFGPFNGRVAHCLSCGKQTCTKCKEGAHLDKPNCKDLWEQAHDKYSSLLCPACARPAGNHPDWRYTLFLPS